MGFFMTKRVDQLYFQYGHVISSGVSERLYDFILEDPDLMPFFNGIDMDSLTEHMADLLCMITGGPELYTGRNLKEAHQSFAITDDIFDKVANHLLAAMLDLNITPEDANLVLEVVAKSKPDVVSR